MAVEVGGDCGAMDAEVGGNLADRGAALVSRYEVVDGGGHAEISRLGAAAVARRPVASLAG